MDISSFADTLHFVKVENNFCHNHYHEEETLVKAIEKCLMDESCKMIYSSSCTTEGKFKLCQNLSDTVDHISDTCAYVKKEIPGILKCVL